MLLICLICFLLLILMAGYLFLAHSIEKRRAQRQRLITALRARRNSFRDLTTGFPAGFLSTDLMALLYRALVDCCEQLCVQTFGAGLLSRAKDVGAQLSAVRSLGGGAESLCHYVIE